MQNPEDKFCVECYLNGNHLETDLEIVETVLFDNDIDELPPKSTLLN